MIVEQFIKWIGTAPADARAKATNALARAYLQSEMDEAERADAEAAMTFLLDDPALEVREALAEVLHADENAPRHIVLALIDDHPDIACLMLGHSPLVIDTELVDYAASYPQAYQCAIAGRHGLSSSVAAALIEVGSLEAVVTLLQNENARVQPSSLLRACERYGEDHAVQQLLLAREDLPIAARQILIVTLSDALSEQAAQNTHMDEERVVSVARDARDRATLTLVKHADVGEFPALVEHLRATEQLTTMLLLRVLCAGEFDFFAITLADLSGIAPSRVHSILSGKSMRNFRALYERAELPQAAYPAFSIALGVYRDERVRNEKAALAHDPYRFTRVMIERILEQYRLEMTNELDDVLIMLRRFANETARDAAREFVQLRLSAA